MTQVLFVDDEEDIRISVAQSLELKGIDVTTFARGDRLLERLTPRFDGLVVSDVRMPRIDGLELLDAIRAIDPEIPVILVSGHADVPLAVEALGRGAYDFIEKPFATDRLVQSVRRAIDKRGLTLRLRALEHEPAEDLLERRLKGRAPEVVELRRRIAAAGPSDLDVLLVGETGTGKELAARALHDLSPRGAAPFVSINLAALPTSHAESELFGHVAGFGGNPRGRIGRMEHARGGTIYLDEIGSAPLALQVKLLRVIEDRAIEPLGGGDRVPLDARFVASTRRPLEDLVAAGDFRDDLLYRVNTLTITLPPLRDRRGDVPMLFHHFVADAARRHGRPLPEIAPVTLQGIAAHRWPGNLRELRSAAERFVLGLGELPAAPEAMSGTLGERMDRFERDVLVATLAAHDGSLKATYESLGLARKTLYEKMQKHGLRREDFTD